MEKKDIFEEEREQDSKDEARFESEEPEDEDEDAGEKTIFVPNAVDMDTYFNKHYYKQLISELNERLIDGSIAEKTGADIVSEHILWQLPIMFCCLNLNVYLFVHINFFYNSC